MERKGLALGIILLFIGVAFIPSINFNVVKGLTDDEFVEITTEVSGIEGVKPQTVRLTQQQYHEVQQLFSEVSMNLKTASVKEKLQVYRDAIERLDDLGLLGNLTREQAFHLATKWYVPTPARSDNRLTQFFTNKSVLCLVEGRMNLSFASRRIGNIMSIAGIWWLEEGYLFLLYLADHIGGYVLLLLPLWWVLTIVQELIGHKIVQFSQARNGTAFGNIIGIGYVDTSSLEIEYGKGWLNSFGLLGLRSWEGMLKGNLDGLPVYEMPRFMFYPAIIGFSGIKINFDKNNYEKYYLGSALAVGLDVKQ